MLRKSEEVNLTNNFEIIFGIKEMRILEFRGILKNFFKS